MAKMQGVRMFSIQNCLVAFCAGITLVTAAWSAEPEPGMWAIEGEINGKPGRGLQIDTQGGMLLIVTYFGYRADGSALFLQASGEMTENARDAALPGVYDSTFPISFTGNLAEYKNGPVLGGQRKDGQVSSVLGQLQIVFDSATTGSITLPGEPPQRIGRFQYENPIARFTNSFYGQLSGGPTAGSEPQTYYMSVTEGEFKLRRSGDTGSYCEFIGPYTLAGKGIVSSGSFACGNILTGASHGSGTYVSNQLVVTSEGFFTGTIVRTQGNVPLTEHYQGGCFHTFVGGLPRCSRMR